MKEDMVDSIDREPVYRCREKLEETCHDTFVTVFSSHTEEECVDHFEKKCQISFRQVAALETIVNCYKPLVKNCSGSGSTECRTEYETSCSTKFLDTSLVDTSCIKVPVRFCGQGCESYEGSEECRERETDVLHDVPEEECDLSPRKVCKPMTKLVPSLKSSKQCTQVPRVVCMMAMGQPKVVKRPLRTEWCFHPEAGHLHPDHSEVEPRASSDKNKTR